MKWLHFAFILPLYFCSMNALGDNRNEKINVDLIALSQQLLLAAKTNEPIDSFTVILSNTTEAELGKQVTTDNQRKAFWLNIYNAYTQILLTKNPDQYKNRNRFFTGKQIVIAGRRMSLDDIEHGILRRSKIKWGLGYINQLFTSAFERKHRVDSVDYRIHFALNCGAKSCPAIAFYKPEQLDKQLAIATKVYLQGECKYDEAANKVWVPALMGWFRGDFGGKKKITSLLKNLSVIPENKNPSISFKKYDWNLFLENYQHE